MYKASSIEEVVKNNKDAGWHFFDEETMMFFGSEVVSELLPGGLFVTVEDTFDRADKRYTVRRYVEETAEIADASNFQEFGTFEDAYMYAVQKSK